MRIAFVFLAATLFVSCIGPKLATSPVHSRRIASLDDQIRAIDPHKRNLCTITINSHDETDTFAKYLTGYNRIELTPDDSKQSDWFDKACQSGIQCDVLVISGHFSGNFFKDGSDLMLEGPTLERNSCSNTCPGILSHPKDVYLFGCNTLAGKEHDSRTPLQYIQVLVKDGYSYADAQMLAAIRYSPFGNSFESKMQRSFAGVQTIHGFDSVAPSGANVRKSVANYLTRIGDFGRFQDSHGTQTDTAWTQTMTAYTAAQAPSASKAEASQSFSCKLTDPSLANYKKLGMIKSLMGSEEKLLQNIEYLDAYTHDSYSAEQFDYSKDQFAPLATSYFKYKIQMDAVSRAIFDKYLVTPLPGMLALQVSLLNIGLRFGWYTQDQHDATVRRLFGDFRAGISQEKGEILCDREIKIPGLTLANFQKGKWGIGELLAVTCLEPRDPAIVDKILADFVDHPISDVYLYDSLAAAVGLGVTTKRLDVAVSKVLSTMDLKYVNAAGDVSEYLNYLLMSGAKCPACDSKIREIAAGFFSATDGRWAEAMALANRMRSNPTDTELDTAMQMILNGSPSASANIRDAMINRGLCARLPLIKSLEDKYLPADPSSWMLIETAGLHRFDSQLQPPEAKMRVTTSLKRFCQER